MIYAIEDVSAIHYAGEVIKKGILLAESGVGFQTGQTIELIDGKYLITNIINKTTMTSAPYSEKDTSFYKIDRIVLQCNKIRN